MLLRKGVGVALCLKTLQTYAERIDATTCALIIGKFERIIKSLKHRKFYAIRLWTISSSDDFHVEFL
jgi:hypothetical protein